MHNDAVTSIADTAKGEDGWLGSDNLHRDKNIGVFIDYTLLLIFGGIPWQVSFFRYFVNIPFIHVEIYSFLNDLFKGSPVSLDPIPSGR